MASQGLDGHIGLPGNLVNADSDSEGLEWCLGSALLTSLGDSDPLIHRPNFIKQ